MILKCREEEKLIKIKEQNSERKKAPVRLQVSIDMLAGLMKDMKKMDEEMKKYKMIRRQKIKFQAKNKELKIENEKLTELLKQSKPHAHQKMCERKRKHQAAKTHKSKLSISHQKQRGKVESS